MNKAQLIGNITKDIELKQTPNWKSVISTSIATNKYYTQNWEKKQDVTFHNIVAWGKTAELMSNYLQKWSKVYVEWEIQNRSYEKDWVTKYVSEINVFNVEFLGGKPDWQNNHNKVQSDEDFAKEVKQEQAKKPLPQDEISVEDIPF